MVANGKWPFGELLRAISTRSTHLNPSALSASPHLCVRYREAARRRFPQSNGLSNPFYTFYMFYGHSQHSHEIK